MDASALKVASTGTIHVKNAAGEPLYDGDKPVRIIVHAPGTRQHSTIEGRQNARVAKLMNENEGRIVAPTPEEDRANMAEDLASVTIAFEGLTYGEGLSGEDMFRALYADPALGFIAKQVRKFINDWSNFQGKSPAI